ncbi:RICIN domain-containing protein [Micromonospora coxensis]|uniref:RICIN domain-containing protein n=1 Tax=Micromonospora coxensis TaxID=356852 RepID=UPI0012FE3D41|nr:RICIN domain-containing protein [Micromonospora coxensis]
MITGARPLLFLAGLLAIGTTAYSVPAYGEVASGSTASIGPAVHGAAAAFGPFGPSTCAQGFVWREARPDDHVCVDPKMRQFVRLDNRNPNQFRNPADQTFGPDTCQQGFVWREATPEDHLCVAPQVRETHKRLNESASNRWAATVSRRGETTTVPFVQFGELDRLHSAYSGRNDLVVDLADMKVKPDTNRPTERVRFLRRGGRVAYQNAFQIMDAASGQCLSVRGGGTENGAGLVLENCGWRANQTWHLQRRADDKWELRAGHSDKCLDAANAALTAPPPGAFVQQWECVGGQNQAWNFTG